jgi:hypothetical protein
VTHPEPTIDEINREFPDAEAFTRNGMCYAKLTGIIVIAAAPTTSELREQIREYFSHSAQAVPSSADLSPQPRRPTNTRETWRTGIPPEQFTHGKPAW